MTGTTTTTTPAATRPVDQPTTGVVADLVARSNRLGSDAWL